VDLNTNFNADWGNGINNIFCPSVENFIGFYPESEREVQNLIKTTLKNKPLLTISYHSKGNIIFYGFNNQPSANIERDKKIGEILSESCGYPLIFTENSTGGYKDWCVDKLKIPAYTFEVGDESLSHPITEEYLPEIYQRNKNIPLLALNLTNEYANQIDFNDVIVQNNKKDISNETNENSFRTRIKSLLERRNSGWRSNCKKQ
jgi:g-D-glutamyl-meso-diaminopimelate peptidase